MMCADVASPLGWAASTSALRSSQRRQLSSSIKPLVLQREPSPGAERPVAQKFTPLLPKKFKKIKNKNHAICCFSTIAVKILSTTVNEPPKKTRPFSFLHLSRFANVLLSYKGPHQMLQFSSLDLFSSFSSKKGR